MEISKIPEFLNELLKKQYSKESVEKIKKGYAVKRSVTLRVNTLKTTVECVKSKLMNENIEYEEVAWSKEALIIKGDKKSEIENLDIYKNGEIYLQSLSSMLPPIILAPKKDMDILDMCAAPRRKNYANSSIIRKCS